MGKLTDKTAIVTGASSGIGTAIAKHLAREGANVVLAARRKEKLEQVAAAIRDLDGTGQVLPVVTDITKRSDVENMAKQAAGTFGDVDILVNNAGAMLSARITDEKVDDWDEMIDVNIKGVLYALHAVLPRMKERAAGHIVNIASVSGLEVTKVSTVYSATKFAVRTITMGLEKELARTGVRVTSISPGQVDTEAASGRKRDRKPLLTHDIARAAVYAVTQPDHVNVNEMTVRPV